MSDVYRGVFIGGGKGLRWCGWMDVVCVVYVCVLVLDKRVLPTLPDELFVGSCLSR